MSHGCLMFDGLREGWRASFQTDRVRGIIYGRKKLGGLWKRIMGQMGVTGKTGARLGGPNKRTDTDAEGGGTYHDVDGFWRT